MAALSISQTVDQIPQTPADIRACTARVRAFRAKAWPAKRSAVVPMPVPLPAPLPEPLPPPAPSVPVGRITVRAVLQATAAHFDRPVDDLVGTSRKQPLVRQRQIAMYVAHKLTGRSQIFLGRTMGGRDHTTILHGVRAIKALLAAGDSDTIDAVEAIAAKLTGGAND